MREASITFKIDEPYIADLLMLVYQIANGDDLQDYDRFLALLDKIMTYTPIALHMIFNEYGLENNLNQAHLDVYLAEMRRRKQPPEEDILKHCKNVS